LTTPLPPRSTLLPYTTLFRSRGPRRSSRTRVATPLLAPKPPGEGRRHRRRPHPPTAPTPSDLGPNEAGDDHGAKGQGLHERQRHQERRADVTGCFGLTAHVVHSTGGRPSLAEGGDHRRQRDGQCYREKLHRFPSLPNRGACCDRSRTAFNALAPSQRGSSP